MMRTLTSALLAGAVFFLSGCGGSNTTQTSGGAPVVTIPSIQTGFIQTSPGGPTMPIFMTPIPPAPTVAAPTPAMTPSVVAFQIIPFSATASDTAGDSTSTTQSVYGQVSGVNLADPSLRLEIYSETTEDFIQPLVGSFVSFSTNDGSFVCPAHDGTIHGVLTINDAAFSLNLLDAFPPSAFPPVDGTQVLAEF